ncbi:helix-turn-helix domain-containing protein [uncultured Clostridium sp.]|uniref:helix-turn-helix domain-containing protein n=1 Tax=uncultured Clostridium sp. TaxID=59620 RepID=UPI00262746BD|nr:helix-turn-helix transcriptional regulator [uncultured Clostridium sp.]
MLILNERLALLRETLGLTTRKFGEKLNITGGAVTNMEKGTRNITDRTISNICREFNVNEEWLKYGFGEIFTKVDSLKQCLKDNNATNDDIKLIKCYLNLDLEIRNKIHEHFKKYFNNI